MKLEHKTSSTQLYRDLRFRDLLGVKGWSRLPQSVRRRFASCPGGGASVVYQGEVVEMQLNFVGRLLANMARLVGAPLPYDTSSICQPAVVIVTEDSAGKGQFWIRQYGRASGFPQIIHSSKRFAGPTGLEEYIGYGIGVALNVSSTSEALYFKSDHYFIRFGRRRMRVPRLLSPGALTIGHHHLNNSQFLFSLCLESRLFGCIVRQDAVFCESTL